MMEWLWQNSGYVVLVAFFVGFCGVALWIYLPRNRRRLEDMRNIPFEGGDN